MKIFIPRININNITKNSICNIDLPIIENSNIVYIYSNEGNFISDKKGIHKLKYSNEIIRNVKINNIDAILDYTKLDKDFNITHIPNENITIKINRYKFMLRRQSKISLIVDCNGKKVMDFYFETNENIDNFSIKEDFSTLISNIRNIISI